MLHVFMLLVCTFTAHAVDEKVEVPKPLDKQKQRVLITKIQRAQLPLGLGGLMVEYVKNYGTDKINIVEHALLSLSPDEIITIYKTARKQNIEIIKNFIQKSLKKGLNLPSLEKMLLRGLQKIDIDEIKKSFAKGADLNYKFYVIDEQGIILYSTPLSYMLKGYIFKNHIQNPVYLPIIEFLIDNGAQIHDKQVLNNFKILVSYALQVEPTKEYVDLINLLLKKGFPLSAVDEPDRVLLTKFLEKNK